MTMKHISFYDSPVMRELERQAVKKGTFKTNSVESIVKQAAIIKKSYAPTNDLYSDMLKLAAGLRERGFVKEADGLESKIFIRKQAETHLYRAIDEDAEDLVEFAHPDGDAKVSDSQDQNGMVETILSRHKKMVEVANKQPTGKYAAVNKNIIMAASEVLGVDLKKFAQDSTDEIESERSYELEATDESQAKVKTINASLLENKNKSVELLQQAKDFLGLNEAWFTLDFKKLLSNPASVEFFAKTAKVDVTRLNSLWSAHKALFGGKDEIAPEDVSNLIYKFNNYQSIYSYFKPYIGNLADTYFKGTKIINIDQNSPEGPIKAQQDSRWINNPNSIWATTSTAENAKLDNGAVTAAANGIKNFFDTTKAELIDKNIPKVIGQAKKIVQGLAGDIDNAINLVKGVPPVRRQVGIALGKLQETEQVLDKVGKETQDPKINEIYDAMGAGTVTANVNNAIWEANNSVKSAVSVLSNNKLNPSLDNPAPADLTESMAKKFQTIGRTLDQFLKSGQKVASKQEMQNIENNREIASNVFSVLRDNKDKPFAMVLLNIHSTFPNVDSPKALDQIADNGLQMVSKYQVGQQANDGFTSQAQWAGQAKPTTSQAPGKPAPSGGTVANKGNQAVKLMQDALNSLGIALEGKFDRSDLISLRNTGQGANVASGDGIWGPRTTAGLTTANKLLNLNLKTNYNQASVNQDAPSNSAILFGELNKIKANSPNGSGTDTTVLDQLPQRIDWTGEPAAATTEIGEQSGNIKLTKNDISNLDKLYEFLIRNGMQQPEVSNASETNIGTEGLKPRTWINIVSWFVKRAVLKYNAFKTVSKDSADLARQYYDGVKKLQQQLVGLGVYKLINEDSVIPANYIKNMFAGGGGGQRQQQGIPGPGDSSGGGSAYNQRRGRGQAPGVPGSMEGTRTRMPAGPGREDNSPPITDIVDLRRSDWFDLPYDDLDSPVLRLSDFQRVPGTRMAQSMFASENMNMPSNMQYQKFLNDLSKQLHNTFNTWAQDASAEEQSAMKEYYNRWQQAIMKQYRDITRRRG